MNRYQLFLCLIATVCSLSFTSLSFTSTASAQCFGKGYGTGYFDAGRLYQQLRIAQVPYFAAFPPVYYSHSVPRTYGYSPFAYLPHVRTPKSDVSVESQEIVNPHVPASSKNVPEGEKEKDMTTRVGSQVQPLLVVNPYIVQPLDSSDMALAQTENDR